MVNKIFSATFKFALALILTRVAHAWPQASPSNASPTPMPSSVTFTPPESSSVPPCFCCPSPSTASLTESTLTTAPSASPNTPQRNILMRPLFLDPVYDNPNGRMDTTACSIGGNGFATEFPMFGDIPSFPFIGGAFDIVPPSPNCGSCWNITNPATGMSIQMTAINLAPIGFTLAGRAYMVLTNGDTSVPAINVVAHKLSTTPCI